MQNKQAIIIIGSPGSGKDVIIRDIVSNYGIVEFTSTQISEMLSDDVAFKRAKPEKRDSLLERYSVIVTANSYELGFVVTKQILEDIGYSTHLIFVEADLPTSIERLKNRENLKESLDKITLGNSNKSSILQIFESKLIIDNSKNLELQEVRSFISDILSELSFKFDYSLSDIQEVSLKNKIKKSKVIPSNTFDVRGDAQINGMTCAESVDAPFFDYNPVFSLPQQNVNTSANPSGSSVDLRPDKDKERAKGVLKKIKKIKTGMLIVPDGI